MWIFALWFPRRAYRGSHGSLQGLDQPKGQAIQILGIDEFRWDLRE